MAKSGNIAEHMEWLTNMVKAHDPIDSEFYKEYNVKRGLRNSDGTGVLVGLTEIGEVRGYIMDEHEKIDVDGVLRYRGIDVRDLVRSCMDEDRFGFEEVIYLVLFGELPTQDELDRFKKIIHEYSNLPKDFKEDVILKLPSKDIMNKLGRCVLSMYSYDENPDDISIANILRQSIDLIAKFPAFVAYAYQAKAHYFDNESLHLRAGKAGLSIAENFLRMMREDAKYTEQEAKILDLALILHAEHGGGNNSSFTMHVVSSTGTDTYSSVSAALGSLKGPLHGGANAKVMGMMDNIKANVKNWHSDAEVRDYLAKIIRKEAHDKSGLVYGIGHAVYTTSDPRAVIFKKSAQELATQKGYEDEFVLYDAVERLTPEVFAEIKQSNKTIAANVDFYTGFVYSMLNFSPDIYTPLFAMSRIVGWCAHRIEELVSGGRIIRPAYKSVCEVRDYVPIDERL